MLRFTHSQRTWLWLLLVVLLVTGCKEETITPTLYGSVQGVVVDAHNNQPLANVIITTNPATSSFATDEEGHFSLQNIAAGKYSISAHKVGFKGETSSITVGERQLTEVTLALEQSVDNQAPNAPFNPVPATGSVDQPVTLTLRWQGKDPDKGDSLRYDVQLYESNSTDRNTLATAIRDTFYTVSNLKYNTAYFWQITTRDQDGLTARSEVWTFRTASFPLNRYVFSRTVDGNTDIYSANADGSTLQRLTTAAFTETAPQISPTRDKIAYTSNDTGQYQLYTMNRDGSGQRRITMLSVEGYQNAGIGYCWSPDGAQLVYSHYDQLYRINRDGTGLALLATAPTGRHFRQCDWTVQGNLLLVQTIGAKPYDSEIYLYNADGSNPRLVVKNLPGRVDSPSFSIDGTEMLYTHDVAGFESNAGRQLNSHIYKMKLDGTNLVDLSEGKQAGTNDKEPRFSPDGASVIFVNQANDSQTPPEVWVVGMDDGDLDRSKLFDNADLPDWK
ncbi:carboxypeptidase-like regulatory domain-containing protein [Hymenobacter sp. BT730]|uniref:carboxypeptidase-like regulatory domain-containing protein n=1 Tax=Hymenobacter sp. BT730 TaxID=3063332 RepID=UPI0026E05250|nr:carboxypeptidase-like regulatory domain-containing protein [Hymenobacter sp. BT730]